MTSPLDKPRKVKVFALSTCGWCKRMKRFLDLNHISFDEIDVDLLEGEDKDQARAELSRFNPLKSYPTTVVDDQDVVKGFDEDRLIEILSVEPCLT